MNYEELVKALRECASDDPDCICNCPYYNHDVCADDLKSDSAAAIEALQAEVMRLNMRCADCEYAASDWPEDPEHTKTPMLFELFGNSEQLKGELYGE